MAPDEFDALLNTLRRAQSGRGIANAVRQVQPTLRRFDGCGSLAICL